MKKLTPRVIVFAAINDERSYQDSRWNADTTESGGYHTVPEFVLYMEHYLGEARCLLSTQGDPKAVHDGLDFVRKVTALGVACMEQNGVVERAGLDVAEPGENFGDAIAKIMDVAEPHWMIRKSGTSGTFYTPGYRLSEAQRWQIVKVFPDITPLYFSEADPTSVAEPDGN
jgi:hypothetical protein